MILTIHIDPKVEKRIAALLEQSNAGYELNAARKASKIIDALKRGVLPHRAGKLNDNGESRIRNCIKYDLGKGYRLICVKSGSCFFVLYKGSHDNCDAWLCRNSRLKPESIKNDFIVHPVRRKKGQPVRSKPRDDEWDYDAMLMARISQEDLRQVFPGIINRT